MKMIFVFVLLLTMAVYTEAGICGNHGQCLCSRSGEVICGDVETAPYFIVSQRPGKRMTLSTRRDFEMDSLTETEGFDHVLLIGPSPSECATAALDFPWVVCPGGTTTGKTTETARKTTETPRLTRSTELTTGTATTDKVTTETGESAAQDQDKKEGKGRLNGMIAWSVISAFFGFVTTICILVSLVNLHQRINTYTACRDRPMWAVHCSLLLVTCVMAPIFLCSDLCKKCPRCCCVAFDSCIRARANQSRRYNQEYDFEMQ